jgi:hypothetical protein
MGLPPRGSAMRSSLARAGVGVGGGANAPSSSEGKRRRKAHSFGYISGNASLAAPVAGHPLVTHVSCNRSPLSLNGPFLADFCHLLPAP